MATLFFFQQDFFDILAEHDFAFKQTDAHPRAKTSIQDSSPAIEQLVLTPSSVTPHRNT